MITLKTLPQATTQEVFDQVARHLIKQGKKSTRADGDCQYRKGNLKCAAGCLIKKSEYEERWENTTWGGLVARGWVPPEHQELIGELQAIHDDYDVKNWELALDKLAVQKSLSFNLAQYKAAA